MMGKVRTGMFASLLACVLLGIGSLSAHAVEAGYVGRMGPVTGFPKGAAASLQFTRNPALPDYVTFTCASDGTYFDSSGVMRTAATDQPRFDYDPATLAPRGLLIEGQRTNTVRTSTGDSFSYAGTGTITRTVSAGVAPDGTTTMLGFSSDSTAAYGYVQYNGIGTADTYTGSLFVAKGTGTIRVTVWFLGGGTAASNAIDFNIATGATSIASGSPIVTVVDLGGYWRIGVTGTNNSTGNANVRMAVSLQTISYQFKIWGYQLELGSFLSSYIPTSGTTVTRAADNASIDHVYSIGWNQSAGTLINEFEMNGLDSAQYVSYAYGGSSAYIRQYFSADATFAVAINNSGFVFNTVAINPVVANTVYKTAFAFALNDGAFVVNGGAPATDTNMTVPAINSLYIGKSNSGGQMAGWIRSIKYYPSRLPNATLQQLTQ